MNSRIHHFLPECVAFNQSALRHILAECIAPRGIQGCHDELSHHMSHRRAVVFLGVDFSGYILLWITCKTTRRRSCLTLRRNFWQSSKKICTWGSEPP